MTRESIDIGGARKTVHSKQQDADRFHLSAATIASRCPPPYRQLYCLNGGECVARYEAVAHDEPRARATPAPSTSRFESASNNNYIQDAFALPPPPRYRFTPYCRCAPTYHGRRCERLFDAELLEWHDSFAGNVQPRDGPRGAPATPYNTIWSNSVDSGASAPTPIVDDRALRPDQTTPQLLVAGIGGSTHLLFLMPALLLILLIWYAYSLCKSRKRKGKMSLRSCENVIPSTPTSTSTCSPRRGAELTATDALGSGQRLAASTVWPAASAV